MSRDLIQQPVILVKVIEDTDFPLSERRVYKCLPCKVEFDEEEGAAVTITPGSEKKAIFCGNVRNNRLVKNAYYFAYRISGRWVIDNQAAFLEYT